MTEKNSNRKISVIIPVYNDQDGLDRALSHISRQTLPSSEFEVIIVDNNSNPPIGLSPELKFSHTLVSYAKPGSYAARNYGVQQSNGQIIAFLDADCYPSDQWLEKGLSEILQNKNTIIGGEILFEKSPHPTATENYQYIVGFDQENNIKLNKFSVTANLITTYKAFQKIGPFNESLLSGGDREWCWRALNDGFSLRFSPDAIVYTKARRLLRHAVIQARRVAGGRKRLHNLNPPSSTNNQYIAPRRGLLQATKFIFAQSQLPLPDRIKIFCIASVLKIVQVTEHIRLMFGASEERR